MRTVLLHAPEPSPPLRPPLHPLPTSSALLTPSLPQPHTSRSIQRVAHHRHWWPSSLGPACLCHFLCVGLLVHVTLCSRGGHACCFTSCSAAHDGQRGVPWSSVTVLLDVMTASWAASLHYAVSEYDGDSFYSTLHSLLACGWMTVFTAHKWSSVHILWESLGGQSGDILKGRRTPLRPGRLPL